MNRSFRLLAVLSLALGSPAAVCQAWDVPGHRIVNQVALASLPRDFPAFVHAPANTTRILYLSAAPDRWRNVDPWLKQAGPSWTDHFIDIEELALAGLDPRTVPSMRYDFALAFAAGRAAHPEHFPPIEAEKNLDRTREWAGFAPWALTEWFQKLRSAFSYLKAYEEVGGTPDEIANAQADAVYVMGIMGHYFGDCAQPLHTTVHHNGWVGPNPHGYTTWPGFHSWIDGKDGGFIGKAGLTFADVAGRIAVAEPFLLASRADGRDPFFVQALDYILQQHALVEPLYRMEKAGLLGHGEQPVTAEARAFFEGQLLKGGTMLARAWVTAWQSAPVDTYLRTQLGKRLPAGTAGGAKAAP